MVIEDSMTQPVETDSRDAQTKRLPSDSRHFEIVDFALAMPSSLGVGAASEPPAFAPSAELGIVGVITILSPKSVMVWLGWGDLRASNTLASSEATSEGKKMQGSQRIQVIGKCTFSEIVIRQAAHSFAANR
jgi:hypothetical protein